MRYLQKAVLVASTAFCFLAPPLFALDIPEPPNARVNDYAGLLSSAAKGQLETRLALFEQETSNQIVVAIFSSLEEEALEDFTIRLAERWKIGQQGKDNGVILAIFKEDRAVRIEVGYGLEGVLPDATAYSIIHNEIAPRFRAGNFDDGIIAAVEAIIAATKGEYQGESEDNFLLPIILFVIFLIIIFALMSGISPRRKLKGPRGKDSGEGFEDKGFRLRPSSGGGSGGFSGGGGGFGGGGASGRW